MFLAIDVGNTQTTLGLFDEDGTVAHGWRMATSHTDTSDMIARPPARVLQQGRSGPGTRHCRGHRVRGACAHPRMVQVPARPHGHRAAGRDSPDGLRHAHRHARFTTQVGADRIANAVAARLAYGAPVIVVDFGTATNIDVVDAAGSYRGGAISPGLMLSAAALFSRAAKLSSVPIEAPAHALGETTEAAVQSGIVVGAAAQAEGLVARIKRELGIPNAPVVGTGGLARTVSAATDLFSAVDPDLTLRGIREIWLHQQH